MTSINDLAREFGAQPYEVAEFADLGRTGHDAPLSDEYVHFVRTAWEIASGAEVDGD